MNTEQEQTVRDWLAVEVMGFQLDGHVYLDPKNIDWWLKKWRWKPDEDAEQRDLVVDKLHRVHLIKHHSRRYEAWVYNTDDEGFPDGSCTAVSPGVAICIAACRASGYEGDL